MNTIDPFPYYTLSDVKMPNNDREKNFYLKSNIPGKEERVLHGADPDSLLVIANSEVDRFNNLSGSFSQLKEHIKHISRVALTDKSHNGFVSTLFLISLQNCFVFPFDFSELDKIEKSLAHRFLEVTYIDALVNIKPLACVDNHPTILKRLLYRWNKEFTEEYRILTKNYLSEYYLDRLKENNVNLKIDVFVDVVA